jgi:hypothetical protein
MGLLVVAWSFGLFIGPPLGTLVFAHNPMILWPPAAFSDC